MNIKTPNNTYEITRAIPETKPSRNWKEDLALVSSIPSRFVGIVDARETNTPFMVYGALIYIGEMEFIQMLEQGPDGQPRMINGQPVSRGIKAQTRIRNLFPYDLMTPVNVEVHTAEHIIWAKDQAKEFQDWIYGAYLLIMDPPRIDAGAAPKIR